MVATVGTHRRYAASTWRDRKDGYQSIFDEVEGVRQHAQAVMQCSRNSAETMHVLSTVAL